MQNKKFAIPHSNKVKISPDALQKYQSYTLDYQKLLMDGMLEDFDSSNNLGYLEYMYGERSFVYFGQIKDNVPNGLGVQIDEEGIV